MLAGILDVQIKGCLSGKTLKYINPAQGSTQGQNVQTSARK
jgi:hypothetical protein